MNKHVKCVLVFIGLAIGVPAVSLGINIAFDTLIAAMGVGVLAIAVGIAFLIWVGFITNLICGD